MEPAALAIRGLAQHFRRGFWLRPRTVLAGVELTLAPGEALGLLGPNGSGKSTLLALSAGLLAPSAGRIEVFGHAAGSRAARREVGFLADGFPFPPELGPREVLELFGALRGNTRRERRARAETWLSRVGLAHEAKTPLGAFSLGMKRRFALAQAAQHEPRLLLLDEPTAGLDAEGHVVLAEILSEARARGAALLLATHVPADLGGCARAIVLLGGRVVERVELAELARDPEHLLALYRRHARAPS
jgi:ABC-type multidrug transport system ATPase subunit